MNYDYEIERMYHAENFVETVCNECGLQEEYCDCAESEVDE